MRLIITRSVFLVLLLQAIQFVMWWHCICWFKRGMGKAFLRYRQPRCVGLSVECLRVLQQVVAVCEAECLCTVSTPFLFCSGGLPQPTPHQWHHPDSPPSGVLLCICPSADLVTLHGAWSSGVSEVRVRVTELVQAVLVL